jgi:hypothetical protein
MEGLGDLIKKRSAAAANKRLHSEAHVLADEMSVYFRERKRFAMYLGIIKRLGIAKARSIFAQVKAESAQADSPRKLFMWLTRDPKKG